MDLLQNMDLRLLENGIILDNSTTIVSNTNEIYQDLSLTKAITGCGGSSESDITSATDNILQPLIPNDMAEPDQELQDLIDLYSIANSGELEMEQPNYQQNEGRSCSTNVAPTMDFGQFLNNRLIAVNSLNSFSACPTLSCQQTASPEVPLCPSGSQMNDKKMKDDKEDMIHKSDLQDNDVIIPLNIMRLLQTSNQDNNETDDNDGIKVFLRDGANQDKGKKAPKEPLVSINILMRGSLTPLKYSVRLLKNY